MPALPPPRNDAPSDDDAVATLVAAVETVVGARVADLDDETIAARLEVVERSVRRLTAIRSLYASELAHRRARAAADARPDDPRAGQRASRQVRRELTDRLKLTPSDAKKAVRTGRELATLDRARAAYTAGDLSDRHITQLVKTLAHFAGDDRDELERLLVEAGRDLDAVAFGKLCRRQLAIRNTPAAQRDLDRLKARRSARLATAPDGTTQLHVTSAGIDGELVHTAIHAFRRPDTAGDPPRTPEQATHDALIEALRAALDHGRAPTQHGVKPHLMLIAHTAEHTDHHEQPDDRDRPPDPRARRRRPDSTADVTAGTGVIDTMWTGPLPASEIRWLVDDCRLTGLLTDAAGTPVAVTEQVRTVPVGLYKLLLVRDRGCIWPSCDTPPGWCDVAHGHTRYHKKGKLSPESAGLLCRRHHRIFDHRNYLIRIIDNTAHICSPDGKPLPRDAITGRSQNTRTGPARPPGPLRSRTSRAALTEPDPPAEPDPPPNAPAEPPAAIGQPPASTGRPGPHEPGGTDQPRLLSEDRAGYDATGPPRSPQLTTTTADTQGPLRTRHGRRCLPTAAHPTPPAHATRPALPACEVNGEVAKGEG